MLSCEGERITLPFGMSTGILRFACFELDPGNRRLSRDGKPVELSARYLDALLLMTGEQGRLVTKERFHQEVWRGIPVTDEALTQCIATLRRQLGDAAGKPRFIETVPKHGYRFIAPVEQVRADNGSAPSETVLAPSWREFFTVAGAGTLGGGAAGLIGGLIYGFSAAAQPGVGAISVLLVLVSLSAVVGLAGAAGVSFGIASAGFLRPRRSLWTVLGAAAGGMVLGAVVKLLGLDAFNLLVGNMPADIAGAREGILLGGAVGLAAVIAARGGSLRSRVAAAMVCGGVAGVLISLLGGRLMLGSLDAVAQSFPNSQLQLEPIGALFGERGLGPIGQAVSCGLEGALFGGCVVGGMMLARRRLG